MSIKETKDTSENKEQKKQQQLIDNRRVRFAEILGDECEYIDAFVIHTHISPWDLKDLVDKGCPPDKALEILI